MSSHHPREANGLFVYLRRTRLPLLSGVLNPIATSILDPPLLSVSRSSVGAAGEERFYLFLVNMSGSTFGCPLATLCGETMLLLPRSGLARLMLWRLLTRGCEISRFIAVRRAMMRFRARSVSWVEVPGKFFAKGEN